MNKLIVLDNIKDKIHTIRDIQVMLDSDLAELYGVPLKRLNEQVKRNSIRFPENFMFQLTKNESEILWSQFETSSWGGRRYLPYVFTEQGVAMLSSVLKSKTAIDMSIQIINSFISMRKFLLNNNSLFKQIENNRNLLLDHNSKINELFTLIESKILIPDKGIFFNGQMFDAHKFISDLIRSAKNEIILVDNYIDDSVLTLFTKRIKGVSVKIHTKNISKQIKLDLEKFNSQYEKIQIEQFSDSHDRFLIIDQKDVYHIGASLKDLGKKWFAFSKFDLNVIDLLKRL